MPNIQALLFTFTCLSARWLHRRQAPHTPELQFKRLAFRCSGMAPNEIKNFLAILNSTKALSDTIGFKKASPASAQPLPALLEPPAPRSTHEIHRKAMQNDGRAASPARDSLRAHS